MWTVERRRIVSARYKFQHEAALRGENAVFTTPEPPVDCPPWWRSVPEPAVTLTDPPEVNDPSRIRLRFGLSGRPPTHKAGENQDTVEDVFARVSLKARAKRLLGVQL
ncbi:MAG: hypothetical protein ACR2NV_08455 [Thermoleophilaceae bacterium]